jgi:hypothetical protein
MAGESGSCSTPNGHVLITTTTTTTTIIIIIIAHGAHGARLADLQLCKAIPADGRTPGEMG